MLLLCVLLLSGILSNTAGVANGRKLRTFEDPMRDVCVPIISEQRTGIPAEIMIKLKLIYPRNSKVPVLMFRYDDILNFTTLPSWEEYSEGYTSNYSSNNLNWDNYFLKNSVNFEENKFILEFYEGYDEIDEKRIYNGFLDRYNQEAVLQVHESGMYCVYLAPPFDTYVLFYLKVQNSNFHSSKMRYTCYCQTKYIIVIGLLLAVYLIKDILKPRTDKQFKFSNMPIISKAVIFYVLVPFLSFISLEWVAIFIETHSNLSDRKITYFEYFRSLIEWIQPNWEILLRFYILIFSMGYGVIYYQRGACRLFSKMPRRDKNTALSFLISNIILSNIVKHYVTFFKYLMSFPTIALYKDTISFIGTIWLYTSLVFPFVWYLISFIYYFRTRNFIKKLPLTLETNGVDAIARIMKAFNQSILIILISPAIPTLARLIVYYPTLIKSFRSAHEHFNLQLSLVDDLLRKSLILLVMSANDTLLKKQGFAESLDRRWPEAIGIYLTIGLLYVIWIRNNNALVVEDEKEDLKE